MPVQAGKICRRKWHFIGGAVESTRLLPTLRLFKIGVRFDVEGEAKPGDQSAPAYTEASRQKADPLTAKEIEFVRVMQRDLPIIPEPFAAVADELSGVALQPLHHGPWQERAGMRANTNRHRRSHRHHRPPRALLDSGIQKSPCEIFHRRRNALGGNERMTVTAHANFTRSYRSASANAASISGRGITASSPT